MRAAARSVACCKLDAIVPCSESTYAAAAAAVNSPGGDGDAIARVLPHDFDDGGGCVGDVDNAACSIFCEKSLTQAYLATNACSVNVCGELDGT